MLAAVGAIALAIGADEHRASALDVALHLAADDQPAADDPVGDDDVALLLDGEDADRLDALPRVVAADRLVFELQRLVAVLAGDALRAKRDLLGLVAIDAINRGPVAGGEV